MKWKFWRRKKELPDKYGPKPGFPNEADINAYLKDYAAFLNCWADYLNAYASLKLGRWPEGVGGWPARRF